jgi:hypothetical protein
MGWGGGWGVWCMELVRFVFCTLFDRNQVSSVCIVSRLRAGRSGVPITAGQEIFLVLKHGDPLWGLTQPPIQWALGLFSWV